MTHRRTRTTDIDFPQWLELLDDVHGDAESRRQSTLDSAVSTLEHDARSAYGALRELATFGNPRAAATPDAMPPAEPSVDSRVSPTAALAPSPGSQDEVAKAADGEAPTRVMQPAPTPAAKVVSGEGAEYREQLERSHTKTHIIRRPKFRLWR